MAALEISREHQAGPFLDDAEFRINLSCGDGRIRAPDLKEKTL